MGFIRTMLVGALLLVAVPALAFTAIELEDPKGDDDGPGSYTYPTDSAYARGAFDLRGVTIEDAGDDVKITIRIAARITDPWKSEDWPGRGKGWSLQMFQVYVDTDHKPKSGFEAALPGMNVRFADESWWEKVILVSPQPDSTILSRVKERAGALGAGVVLPRKVTASGKKFVALVSKKDLGEPAAGWGWQVLTQSNEGYDKGTDILSRKVNEFNGQHRFGGGSDYDCDPHVLDILVPPAKGGADEKAGQHEAMKYTCDPADPESTAGQARLPMVYR